MDLFETTVRPGRAISTAIGFLAIHEGRGKTPYQVAYARAIGATRGTERQLLDEFSKLAATIAQRRPDKVLELLGAK